MRRALIALLCFAIVPLTFGCSEASYAQDTGSTPLDMQVRAFLDKHRGTWRDLNVPESDGRLLYDLILKNRTTSPRYGRR